MTEPDYRVVLIMAQHADYVTDGARICTCGEWGDLNPDAQSTRIPFIRHVLASLANHGYAIDGPRRPTCAWCPDVAHGDAYHNDGLRHPSCGRIDHGQNFYTRTYPTEER